MTHNQAFCRSFWALLLSLTVQVTTFAQSEWGNRRVRYVSADAARQILDTLTVINPLWSVRDSSTGAELPLSMFRVENRTLITDTAALHTLLPACKTLEVRYRVLTLDLGKVYRRLDTTILRTTPDDPRYVPIAFDFKDLEDGSGNIWKTPGVATTGSYTRGLALGNNQNLNFNSNLNLQIDGKLGNDLQLTGALSDNSIPLQPEGTTGNLQEFDRIFIQLKRKNAALIAGDFELANPTGGYFMNYFKKLQGGSATVRAPVRWGKVGDLLGRKQGNKMTSILPGSTPLDTVSFRVAGAVARGKFVRQPIAGIEGNQGPYRLQGAEGERFIIVLAGTERVYIDGVLLKRGLEEDYIIDYNLAEVVFTARRFITKDIRIIVEFEYSVQNYIRSSLAADVQLQHRKSRYFFNIYSEQDSKNSTGLLDLKPEQRALLAQSGDSIALAFSSGVDTLTDGYSPSRVSYRYADTVACGQPARILVYATRFDTLLLQARFSEVPQGQGNYILIPSNANGRVYQWVAPDPLTCQPQGNYEPVIRLIAPEMRRMMTLGAEHQFAPNTSLRAEAALSNKDFNRYSPLDGEDDRGLAGFVAFKHRFTPAKQKDLTIDLQTNYEYAQQNFTALNPYRPQEFTRDWNTDRLLQKTEEHLGRGSITLAKKGYGSLRYEMGGFLRGSVYDGVRHFGQFRFSRKGYEVLLEGNLLSTNSQLENSVFSRPRFDIARTFSYTRADKKTKMPYLKLGVYGEREKNRRFSPTTDSLYIRSFYYDLGRVYFQVPEHENRRLSFGGFLSKRKDYAPVGIAFSQSTEADEANLNGKWSTKPKRKIMQSIEWTATYRSLDIVNTDLSLLPPQNTWLSKIDYTANFLKNAIVSNTAYELGSGQNPKLQFNYVLVNPGEGNYTWIDRNQDSTLQVDEMEIAVFQDQANYIRLAASTNDFIRTNNIVFAQSFRFEPRLIWAQKKGYKRLLKRFSTQSNLQISRKVQAGSIQGLATWNPFLFDIPDTSLISVTTVIRNSLFINRADPIWDVSLSQSAAENRYVLTTGFESRSLADQVLHLRINPGRKWTIESDLTRAIKANKTENFVNRNYRVLEYEASPQVSWLPSRQFRLTLKYAWLQSNNDPDLGGESADRNDINTTLTWNPTAKENASGFKPATSLRAQFTFADIRYTGAPNTPVSYAMLEGLQNGKNLLWNLSLDRQLTKVMQLSLTYEGRKPGIGKVVHVGRAQVRALF